MEDLSPRIRGDKIVAPSTDDRDTIAEVIFYPGKRNMDAYLTCRFGQAAIEGMKRLERQELYRVAVSGAAEEWPIDAEIVSLAEADNDDELPPPNDDNFAVA